MTKKEMVKIWKEKLGSNAAWAIRALEVIFNYQTEAEKVVEETHDHNGVGFTSTDAEILSSFAKQHAEGRQFTGKQMTILYRCMPKYAGQLIEHSLRVGKVKKVGRSYEICKASS